MDEGSTKEINVGDTVRINVFEPGLRIVLGKVLKDCGGYFWLKSFCGICKVKKEFCTLYDDEEKKRCDDIADETLLELFRYYLTGELQQWGDVLEISIDGRSDG